MFSKSQIRLLRQLIEPMPLKKLAGKIGLSNSRASELVTDLEQKKLVKWTERMVFWSGYSYAQALKQLLQESPAIPFEEILFGKKMDVLLSLSFLGKNLQWIASDAKTTKKTALGELYKLRKRGLVYKEGEHWYFNKDAWPKLDQFMKQYSRFHQKELFAVPHGSPALGTLTGFSVYPQFGVLVHPKTDLYLFEKKRLSINDVFVHSLYQVNDTRTRKLAKEFYDKNKSKLDKKKVRLLAVYFGLEKKLGEVIIG